MKKKKGLPKQYKAKKGSSRAKKIRKAHAEYKKGNKKKAFAMRERQEAKVRKTGSYGYKKKKTSKKKK